MTDALTGMPAYQPPASLIEAAPDAYPSALLPAFESQRPDVSRETTSVEFDVNLGVDLLDSTSRVPVRPDGNGHPCTEALALERLSVGYEDMSLEMAVKLDTLTVRIQQLTEAVNTLGQGQQWLINGTMGIMELFNGLGTDLKSMSIMDKIKLLKQLGIGGE